ncbi:hypothetical protein NHG22_33110, partial [Streptomyces sp. ATE26]|nr:hypothetical protein [Streptomyces sp. ATE26]
MRANRRILRITAVLGTIQTATVLLATHAVAAPSPTPTPTKSDDACDLIRGAAKQFCEKDKGGSKKGLTTP